VTGKIEEQRMFEISEATIDKVVAALNMAVALATRFDPALRQTIGEAAIELDEAIGDNIGEE
jgi:hypothetical protein